MKITFEGSFDEIQDNLGGLFGRPLRASAMFADQAAASAARADACEGNCEKILAEIKNLKGEEPK